MLRLFISLYFVIILGITLINWGSEFIWLQLNHPIEQELNSTKTFAQAIPALINNQQQFLQFQQDFKLPITSIPMDNIAWLKEQLQQLKHGKAIVNYNHLDQAIISIKSSYSNDIYQIGPLPSPINNESSKYILIAFSYFLLALIIAFWTKPIWRDLKQLSQMAEKINENQFTAENTIATRSAISPIVKTINHMAKRIQKLISEQKQLINAVSHELRTPLSRLRFSVALIENLDQQQQQDINQDISEVETLVDEMLSYSRLEHIAQQQKKIDVNITELLNNQIEKLQRGSAIELINQVESQLTCRCQGDLLERATQNLITNAIRYANKKVIVSANIIDNNLQIIVEDDGCGITPEQRVDLFKPFTRVDKSRNKQQGGFGLGLAIVKKAIDWHNGQCLIESSKSDGALFKLLLPLK